MTLPFSQAAKNNKIAIGEVLVEAFSSCKTVLEIASGTGQHAVYMGALMPDTIWQTSDLAENHDSIFKDWRMKLAIMCGRHWYWMLRRMIGWWGRLMGCFLQIQFTSCPGNMWKPCLQGLKNTWPKAVFWRFTGLINMATNLPLRANARFDQWLKDRDPQSGVRDFEAVDRLAQSIGLQLQADHKMPANNQLLIWRRGVKRTI